MISPPNKSYRDVHIKDVRVGDTVACQDGKERTVCAQSIRKDPFIGTTLWGDSYMCGRRLVRLVEFR